MFLNFAISLLVFNVVGTLLLCAVLTVPSRGCRSLVPKDDE